jgi:putative endonuclease
VAELVEATTFCLSYTVKKYIVSIVSLTNYSPTKLIMKGYLFILLCSNGKYYTGSTNELERRINQHQNGEGLNFTKKNLPVELVYVEEFPRIDQAFYREKQIQGWNRKKKEALINGENNLLPGLAKNYTQFPR